MKAARKHYTRCAVSGEALRAEIIAALTGAELSGLWNYALGREPGEKRDAVLLDVIMQAGKRYLTKQSAKQAKRTF